MHKDIFFTPIASFGRRGVARTEDRNYQNDCREDLVSDYAHAPAMNTSDLYSGKVFYAMETSLLTPEEGNA